jgi:glycosyltransferase involved in cell wall biosynthesis
MPLGIGTLGGPLEEPDVNSTKDSKKPTVIVTPSPLRVMAAQFGLTWPHTTEVCRTVSVIIRTQLRRPASLIGAVRSVMQQLRPAAEILIVVHGADQTTASTMHEQVRALLIAELDSDHRMVRIVEAIGRRRGHPINVGFAAALGDMVVLLDDDDVALPDWISTFVETASEVDEPMVIRAHSEELAVRWVMSAAGHHKFVTVGKAQPSEQQPLSLPRLLFRCRSTPASVAYPRLLLDQLGIRADEELELFEDWDLLTRAAQAAGYVDVSTVTSQYRLDLDGGSISTEDDDAVNRSYVRMRKRLDQQPLILPPGSLRFFLEMHQQANQK